VSAQHNAVESLAALLREVGAAPRISRAPVVRSTLYDLDYHVAIVASVFALNGQERTDGTRSMVPHWLKLLQFVAVRPTLLPRFQAWATTRRQSRVGRLHEMPRGFLGDVTHDRTVEFLVASSVLYRGPDALFGGERFDVLELVWREILERNLLAREREVLRAMAAIPVNKTLLGGR